MAILEITPLGFPWQTSDPFLFCVHHEDLYPAGNEQLGANINWTGRNIGSDFTKKDGFRMYHGRTVPGFPAHPHRGFETVTIAQRGLIDHSDSLGAAGRFGNGDVQWMTAGSGVQHSEMFPLLNQDDRNQVELFQIWLNLPKAKKMAQPHFAMLWNEKIPKLGFKDSNGKSTEIELIAGKMNNELAPSPAPESWAANPDNHVAIWLVKLEANAEWHIPTATEGLNRTVYFYEGEELSINNKDIPFYHSARLDSSKEATIQNGNAPAKVLILQGKPIDEPVVQHGPFVMNTAQEIQNAMSAFHATQFGGWPWPKADHVHPKEKGRFALFADGTEETPK